MNSLSDQFLIKAIDNYPFNLTEAMEALNYALSYDDENPVALKLMGQFYADQIQDFETAITYYQKALGVDPLYSEIYPELIWAYSRFGEYEKAIRAAEFALKLKGTNRGYVFYLMGLCYELEDKFKKSLKHFEKSKKATFNSFFLGVVKSAIKRIEDKMPKKKNSKKTKKGKKKKK